MPETDHDAQPEPTGPGSAGEPLVQTEERFRLLVEGVKDYAIFLLNPEGRISSWNAGAERIKGYTADEILGQHFSRFYLPEDLTVGKPERALQIAREEGRVEDVGWRLRKDGSRFWANVVITALRDARGNLLGYAKVTRDLTEQKRIEALEEQQRQVSAFLGMMAHELRNPLASIRNAIGAMQLKGISEASQRWSREVIERQVAHLGRLVDDLLDVSRITLGQVTLQKLPLEVAAVVARAVESCRPIMEARKHTLTMSLPNEPVRVEGDLGRLSQVVANLLDNAARYTPTGGRIWLTVETQGELALIRVRDTGAGIPSDLVPHIFDMFRQGVQSIDRPEGGMGIGLTLVRRLVELHHGTVEAFSEGPGHGSEFVVRLPIYRPPALDEPRRGDEADQGGKGHRVLVVDDNRDSADSMAMLLRLWGHDTRTANDGAEALQVAATYRPEAVLLDIGLPVMNGYEVARELRRLPGQERVTIVAMTGYGQDEDRRRSQQAGFDHHLVKPVDHTVLQHLLASLGER